MKNNTLTRDLLILFAAAFLIRFLYAVPGLTDPGLLCRPDSISYLNPARSLIHDMTYSVSGIPTALRVPGYPALLALSLALSNGSMSVCIVIGCLIGALAVPLIFLSGKELGFTRRAAYAASLFNLFAPTAIAFSPMFLSDSFFSVICALELYLLIRFLKRGTQRDLYGAALTGALGALTRPLNLLWIATCIFAAFLKKADIKVRIFRAVFSVLLFVLVVFPWILRNHENGFGWRIDTVSADSLRHNASVVESRVRNVPAEKIRNEYDQYFSREFSENPDRYPEEGDRLTFQEQYLSAKIKAHPFVYLRGFLSPALFVPDVPTFLENLRITSGGRGTWDVIVKEGFIAGIKYYFRGNHLLLIFALSVGLAACCFYFCAGAGVVLAVLRKDYDLILIFLCCAAYYLLVVGPVNYPRFHLPALPALCLLAVYGFSGISKLLFMPRTVEASR